MILAEVERTLAGIPAGWHWSCPTLGPCSPPATSSWTGSVPASSPTWLGSTTTTCWRAMMARHVEWIHALAVSYWESCLGRAVIAANVELFRRLVGLDLHVQRNPYLRVVRPGKPGDAAPLHRDTYYGASPFRSLGGRALHRHGG